MRRTARTLIMVVTALTALTTAAATAPAAGAARTTAAPYCGITWGSGAERASVAGRAPNTLTGVRAGRQTCYDRLVVDVAGKTSFYDVRYVDQVRTEGEGAVVPLAGGARLAVVVGSPAYDGAGRPTYDPADPAHLVGVTGWTTFRQVAWAGTFEGQTTLGLGVRARLPFRVFVLDGPGSGSRVVVDVAHRW